MKSNKKNGSVLPLSPAGKAMFPHLMSPDTKYSKKGKYGVQLLLDPEIPEHREYLDNIHQIVAEEFEGEKGVLVPIKDDEDSSGEATGKVLVKYSSGFKPLLFDRFNKPLAEDQSISRGAIIRVAATVNVYRGLGGKNGINLYCSAVQMKGRPERDAEFFGFVADPQEPQEGVSPFADELPSFDEAGERMPF